MAYTSAQLIAAWTAANNGLTPDAGTQALLNAFAAQTQTGAMSDATALAYVINSAQDDVQVAVQAYQFFTGAIPSAAGLDYLTNSTTNTTDLNDAYYAQFNLENRYINFAANLGSGVGEGAAGFAAAYGALSFAQAVDVLYETIIGSSYAAAAGINVVGAKADIVSRYQNFVQLATERGMITSTSTAAQIDLAVKASLVGYLMAEGVKADVGIYAAGANNFVNAMIQGNETYSTSLITTYSVQGGGTGSPIPSSIAKTVALTTGVDAVSGAAGNDTFNANVDTTAATAATNTTFNSGDSVTGGLGKDTLSVQVSGNVAPGTIGAGVSTNGVEVLAVSNNSSAGALTVDATLMSGLQEVSITGGLEAVTVTNVGSIPTVNLSATSKNATITGTTASVAGTADKATVNISSVAATANTTFTYNGIEQLNVVSSGSTNGSATTSLTLASNALQSVHVSGSAAASLTVDLQGATGTTVGTVDASAMTGDLTLAVVNPASNKLSVTGGTGNDIIDLNSTLANGHTLDGGAGTDTLAVQGSVAFASSGDQVGANVKNFEVLRLDGGATVDARALASAGFTGVVAVAGGSATKTAATVTSLTAAGDGAVTLTRATDTAADSLKVTINNATANTSTTLSTLSLADEETLTITSSNSANTITSLTGTDLTKLVIEGDKNLTISAITGTALAEIDASKHTGAALSITASNATAATKVTAGTGTLTVTTGTGNDTVTGAGGNDVITTGLGNDSVVGGAGNDSITTDIGNDTVDGGDGIDTINVGSGNDSVTAGAGNDTITAGVGEDTILGGDGDDTTYMTSLQAGDSVDGGAGTDVLRASASSTNAVSSFVTINDSVAARIAGVETGFFAVTVDATANQTLATALNFDMTAVTGMTTAWIDLASGGGTDFARVTNFGGTTIRLSDTGTVENITLDGVGQSFTVDADAMSGGALTVTGVGNLTISGRATNSNTSANQANTLGAVVASSATGVTLSTTGSSTANTGALTTGTVTAGDATFVTLSAGANDTLQTAAISATNGAAQTLSITAGTSSTVKNTGNQLTFGTDAVLQTATINVGEAGNLFGNAANTDLDVVANTIASLTMALSANSNVDVDLSTAVTSGTITIANGATLGLDAVGRAGLNSSLTISGSGAIDETMALTGANFTLNASGVTNTGAVNFNGSALTGTATITGTAGNNSIDGGAGNDSLSGGLGVDTLAGGNGNDTLAGGDGGDSLVGGAGNDSINGGEAADTITGGNGNDTINLTETTATADVVLYTSTTLAGFQTEGGDTITAFSAAAGLDIIQFATAALENGTETTTLLEIANNGVVADNSVLVEITTATAAGGADTAAEVVTHLTGMTFQTAVAAGDKLVFAINDGTDTYLWYFQSDATAALSAAEFTLVGVISGVTNLNDGDLTYA